MWAKLCACRPPSTPAQVPSVACPLAYTVRTGDTWTSIAAAHSVHAATLAHVNPPGPRGQPRSRDPAVHSGAAGAGAAPGLCGRPRLRAAAHPARDVPERYRGADGWSPGVCWILMDRGGDRAELGEDGERPQRMDPGRSSGHLAGIPGIPRCHLCSAYADDYTDLHADGHAPPPHTLPPPHRRHAGMPGEPARWPTACARGQARSTSTPGSTWRRGNRCANSHATRDGSGSAWRTVRRAGCTATASPTASPPRPPLQLPRPFLLR